MKKKKLEKKKRGNVRVRDWEKHHEYSFTHDLVKHRRALGKLNETTMDEKPLPAKFTTNGIVISHAKKWAFVLFEEKERLCLIDERLQARGATLLAPGDEVLIEFEEEDALVRGIAARRTKLSRPAGPHGDPPEKVFAANIDLLVVVASVAQPRFREGLLDRFLIAAMVGGVQPLLCMNKIDLGDIPEECIERYRGLGVDVVLTSCVSGAGIKELRQALVGKRAVVCGHSGVGKSSLLNALDPDLEVLTSEVSDATEKGRHTTSASRLYRARGGLWIIDTPGIRALGLWDVTPEGLAYYFPEIAEAASQCRFNDCIHVHEPGCMVRESLETGSITRARFDSYFRIRASLESSNNLTPGRLGVRR